MKTTHDVRPTVAGSDQAGERLDPHLLRIASVVVLGTIMSILDTTITNVALEGLSKTFGTSLATTQWVSTGYMLALATVIPLTGWAADRFGTKRLYMASILFFLVGSALSGAAWSAQSLIVFRVLQGFGGGMIMPAGMTILSQAAGPRRMGRLMGIIGVPMLLGPILGPILGGWFVDDVSWRGIFFVNLPIGSIALYAAARILEFDQPKPHHALDWRGLLLLSPGLATLVYGLAQAAAAGNFTTGAVSILVGLALVTIFVVHALRREGALIDVGLVRNRTVAAATLTIFLFSIAFFGMSLLLPLYFQLVRGGSALDAGLLLAAQGVGAMIAMPLAGLLTDRTGPRTIVLTGLGFVALSMLSLSLIESTTPYWLIELTLFIMGLGMGSSLMPTMSAALATLRHQQIARANSGLNVVERIGGSIGTAVFAVVLTNHMARLGVMFGNGSNEFSDARYTQSGGSADLLAGLGHAFGNTFLWSFAIIVLAMFAAIFLPRNRADGIPPSSTNHS